MQRVTQVITTGGLTTTNTSSPAGLFPSCTLDYIKHFNADRTVTIDDGPFICQPPAAYTWDFAANETEMVFSSPSFSYRSKIAALTATTLELVDSDAFPDGTTIVQTAAYVAK